MRYIIISQINFSTHCKYHFRPDFRLRCSLLLWGRSHDCILNASVTTCWAWNEPCRLLLLEVDLRYTEDLLSVLVLLHCTPRLIVTDAYQVKRIPFTYPLDFLFVWNGTGFFLLHRFFWPAVAHWRNFSHPCWHLAGTDVLSIWVAALDLNSESSLVPRQDMPFASVSSWGSKTIYMPIVYEPSTKTLYMTTWHDRTQVIFERRISA